MSKNDPKNTVFHKYDVEASIDEVENTETQSVFKYGFTILSNPKNVRLTIEGVTKISGNPKELDDILSKDENDVPKILSTIYQELFPTFFLLSKSLNVSCPPIQIGGMSAGNMTPETNIHEINDIIENTNEMTDDATSTEMSPESKLENPDIAQSNI